MKVAYVNPHNPVGVDFRGNPKDGQVLLTGEDDAPDNYRLSYSRQAGPFYSPRHKHNFDQIRMVLGGGAMNYGPKKWIQPGELAYFPEGTPFLDKLDDPDFQAAAARSALPIDALDGERLQALVNDGGELPAALVERARALVGIEGTAN